MSAPEYPLILVVDDDPMTRLLVREALEPHDFRVVEAEDGEAGLRQADALRPDLVLLDVMMPRLDGFRACESLRARPAGRHLPVLMMTGLDDTASIQRAFHVGATDFVTKPINFECLKFRLRYMLRAKAVADALRDSETMLATAQRLARLGHWEYSPERGFVRWSPQASEVLGLSSDTILTQLDEFVARAPAKEREWLEAAFLQQVARETPEPFEFRVVDAQGAERTIQQLAERQVLDDGSTRWLGTVQDITERRRAERQIHDLEYVDQVTGLPNRKALHHALSDLLGVTADRARQAAVLAINLDYFQRVNEHVGHAGGNELLKLFGRRLCGHLRIAPGLRSAAGQPAAPSLTRDFVARLSGDQFCVLLGERNTQDDVQRVADRIRGCLEQPFFVNGLALNLGASIGVALAPEHGTTPDALLRHADLALNHAKRRGRNRTETYKPALDERSEQRLTLEGHLRQAIGTPQLSLYYQPKVRPDTGQTVGMEALVRWTHPTLGRVSPGEFIPVAEATGLILPLGEWILGEACRQLAQWHDEGLGHLVCAVNLSAAQFRLRDLAARVDAILKTTGLPPDLLQLELTESLVMGDEQDTLELLNALRALGVGLAIDDFGTGYSSLSYLKRLPVDTVKIDQSFVRELTDGSDDAAIVDAVIAMAHSLRLKVVAEGVEHRHQFDFLRRRRCDEIQGYYVSQPLAADAFVDRLRRGHARRTAAVASARAIA